MTDPEPTPAESEVLELLQEDDHTSIELANKLDKSPSTVKDQISNLRDKGYVIHNGPQNTGYYLEHNPAEERDYDAIVEALKGGATYEDLESEFGFGRHTGKKVIEELVERGYTIEHKTVDNNGTKLWFIPDETDKPFKVGDGDGTYTFALISDTHLGSQATHLDELHDFYDRLSARGIDTVFHAGDISDGWKVHKGHVNVIKGEAAGWGRLREYVVDNYPKRKGVDTFFIEGNHDNKYHRRNSVHFGELIANRREDLHYCGDSMARFIFDEENEIDLELIHPSGGKPYTLGYRIQTLYRERSVDNRPTIAGVGHLHGSMFAQSEGVIGLYTGAWKGLTTYGKRKGHDAKIGGWIIEMEIENGEVRRFVPEWVGYDSKDTTNMFSMTDVSEMKTKKTR